MAHDQAIHLFDLSMGKLADIGVAVRAFHITMGTIKVEVLGNIQEPELPFLTGYDVLSFAGNITEPSIPVAEKAMLFINRLRLTMKQEKAPQGEQGNHCGKGSS